MVGYKIHLLALIYIVINVHLLMNDTVSFDLYSWFIIGIEILNLLFQSYLKGRQKLNRNLPFTDFTTIVHISSWWVRLSQEPRNPVWFSRVWEKAIFYCFWWCKLAENWNWMWSLNLALRCGVYRCPWGHLNHSAKNMLRCHLRCHRGSRPSCSTSRPAPCWRRAWDKQQKMAFWMTTTHPDLAIAAVLVVNQKMEDFCFLSCPLLLLSHIAFVLLFIYTYVYVFFTLPFK